MYMNGWQMGGMWLFWIAASALIVVVAVLFARAVRRPPEERGLAESILKERYARGEINREEYDRMAADIRR